MDGRKCGVISCQSLARGQEDIHVGVGPATALLLILLLNRMSRQEHAASYTEFIKGQLKFTKTLGLQMAAWSLLLEIEIRKLSQFGHINNRALPELVEEPVWPINMVF